MRCERCGKKLRPAEQVIPIYKVDSTTKYAGELVESIATAWAHFTCPQPKA